MVEQKLLWQPQGRHSFLCVLCAARLRRIVPQLRSFWELVGRMVAHHCRKDALPQCRLSIHHTSPRRGLAACGDPWAQALVPCGGMPRLVKSAKLDHSQNGLIWPGVELAGISRGPIMARQIASCKKEGNGSLVGTGTSGCREQGILRAM